MEIFKIIIGLLAGVSIGYGFGLLQVAALRRNEMLERGGKLKGIMSLIPGSGQRIAYLLVALALVQIVCPLLFTGNSQWWVSGGVIGGYGAILFARLKQKIAAAK